jgi:hypothetical protein
MFVTGNQGLVEPDLFSLPERQQRALAKFEDHAAFEKVWAQAGRRLHKRIQNIRDKVHRHHRKRVVYEDEDY